MARIPPRSRNLTRLIARDWAANDYYATAEQPGAVAYFWRPGIVFRRFFDQLDRRHLLELACGHGRHAAHLLAQPMEDRAIERLTVMDVNASLVAFCRRRLTDPRVACVTNDGFRYSTVPDASLTGIYCYDAMVHFEVDAVQSYLLDSARVLTPGGKAVFHHSNYDQRPGSHYSDNPHARNYMSAGLFRHLASRAGLDVVDQRVIDWADAIDLDAVTLVRRP